MTIENAPENASAKISLERSHYEAEEELRASFNEFAGKNGAFAIKPDKARSSKVMVDYCEGKESAIADLTLADLRKIHATFEQEMLQEQGVVQGHIEASEAMLRLLESNMAPDQTIEQAGFSIPAKGGAA